MTLIHKKIKGFGKAAAALLLLFLLAGNGYDKGPVVPHRDDNLALGNPSGAAASTAMPNNYLLVRPQYVLSYNNARGTANWVSWHLNGAWKGKADRCDCFTPDAHLPEGFYRARTSYYKGTGFDRGHLCPSDDRDGSREDNASTFLMTNIVPQAPHNNQRTWKVLEEYCRALADSGYEMYIICGVYGTGGTGSKGQAVAIAGGGITVPARLWKVVVVLPEGGDDLHRIHAHTRLIAVDMPNNQEVDDHPWEHYKTTVDHIESVTGYDLLSNLPEEVQEALENRKE